MTELLSDYKDFLKTTYKYSEELAENIAVLADSMVEYYGEDYRKIVYDAIASCKFSVEKTKKSGKMQTVEDILKAEDSFDRIIGLQVKRDLRSATVAYGAKPVIDSTDGKYSITNINRTIALSSRFSWENPDSLNNLATETDRLINSYLNGFEIVGKNLIVNEGLSTRVETLCTTPDGIARTFKSESGFGLEDGITLYNAQSITRKSYFSDYDSRDFDENRLTAGVLLDSAGLKEVIMSARLTKDTEELKSILGENYNDLISALDQIHSLIVERGEALGDSEKLRDLTGLIDGTFTSSVAPITFRILSNLTISEVGNVLK